MRQRFLVDGLVGESELRDVVLNPYSGEPVAEVHLADAADAERALRASLAGVRAMRALPPYAVAEILDRAAALVEVRAGEFAALIVAESGKPLYDARGEVARSILNLRAAAEESKRVAGHEVPLDVDGAVSAYQGRRGEGGAGRRRLAVTRKVPIGTVLAVTPFNFPLNLVLHKVAPALAARNAVILKPAPQTPLTGLLLGEVLLEAGLPPQALSVLPCGNDVAELLVRDDRVAMLTFTGSARVGWYLKSCAGRKRVTLELGGNGGVLIDESCDELAYAAQRAPRSHRWVGARGAGRRRAAPARRSEDGQRHRPDRADRHRLWDAGRGRRGLRSGRWAVVGGVGEVDAGADHVVEGRSGVFEDDREVAQRLPRLLRDVVGHRVPLLPRSDAGRPSRGQQAARRDRVGVRAPRLGRGVDQVRCAGQPASITGPTSVASSAGSPTTSRSVSARYRSRNSSAGPVHQDPLHADAVLASENEAAAAGP